MGDDQLGPLVRLWGVPVSQLPYRDAAPSELKTFITSVLQEAVPFIDSAAAPSRGTDASGGAPSSTTKPNTSRQCWTQKGTKTFSSLGQSVQVETSQRVVPKASLEAVAARHKMPSPPAAGHESSRAPETWACRRSVHEDAARRGSASWDEFERSFRVAHGESEMAMMPNVKASRAACEWDCDGLEVNLPSSGGGNFSGSSGTAAAAAAAGAGGTEDGRDSGLGMGMGSSSTTWGDFKLELREIRHKLAPILRERVFGALILTAAARGRDEFVVVSLPVRDLGSSEFGDLVKEGGIVNGAYVSVERVRKMGSADGSGEIEWTMATASDAKGSLPTWLQAKALNAVVAKDVDYFLKWISEKREKEVAKQAVNESRGPGNEREDLGDNRRPTNEFSNATSWPQGPEPGTHRP